MLLFYHQNLAKIGCSLVKSCTNAAATHNDSNLDGVSELYSLPDHEQEAETDGDDAEEDAGQRHVVGAARAPDLQRPVRVGTDKNKRVFDPALKAMWSERCKTGVPSELFRRGRGQNRLHRNSCSDFDVYSALHKIHKSTIPIN